MSRPDNQPLSEAPLQAAATAAVRRWERDLDDLDRRRTVVLQKLETARSLLALMQEDTPEDGALRADEDRRPAEQEALSLFQRIAPAPEPAPVVPADASWVVAVKAWVHSAPLGITYPELRAMNDKTPGFAERLRQSEKGYYNAISRLAARHDIIKYNNRLFSPAALAEFKRGVAQGIVEDDVPINGAYSPMGEAILDIVYRHTIGGILGKDILKELRRDPEFDATLTPHNSGAYNIIARLVKRRQIIRRDDGLCFPGIKFPKRDPSSRWLQDPALAVAPNLRVVGQSNE